MNKNIYIVTVSNIGTVYDGCNQKEAKRQFSDCKKLIKLNYGNFACECVTLLMNGCIENEYFSPDFNFDV